MPRKKGKVPSYCLHKASGRAVVRLDDIDHYLGEYGSDQSHELYQRAIAEWRERHRNPATQAVKQIVSAGGVTNLTIEEVLGLYWCHAKTYYVKDGQPTGELHNLKYAMRPLRKLYGSLRACEFSPSELKALRQHLIESDLCRTEINARINRVRRIFRWAVSEKLVPANVHAELVSVTALRFGRTEARETEPVKPVPDAWVEALLPFVSDEVATMIRVQRLTAMRPNEVACMRISEIDMSGETWIYEPREHKNQYRGHRRQVPLGPKAQQLITPYMDRAATDFLFSPVGAEDRRNSQRRKLRKSPLTPSQARRTRVARPRRPKRNRYGVDSYRRAITRGIKKAAKNGVEIPHWSPNQLRHSRATEICKLHGIEGAQVSLGHAHAKTTEIYAERNLERAVAIAKETG